MIRPSSATGSFETSSGNAEGLTADRRRSARSNSLGHETRNAILAAAEKLVAQEGVASLTFDLLAKAAKVSRGGVLYHFASKEALIEAMVERFIDRFDTAVDDGVANDPNAFGRNTRSYVRASVGEIALTGAFFDRGNGAITAALANFPERLEPVRRQGLRSQQLIEADGLDPVFATIIRLAMDGLWLGENFNLMQFDPELKATIVERLTAWTALEQLPSRESKGGPGKPGAKGRSK